MSVIPASCLSLSDLSRLGNNLRDGSRRRGTIFSQRRRERRQMAAINRSLAGVVERIGALHTTPAAGKFDRRRGLSVAGNFDWIPTAKT